MRYTNVKTFHRAFFEEVKDLPVTVTRFGKPYLIVDRVPVGTEVKETKFVASPSGEKNYLLKKCVVMACDRSGKANVKIEGKERFVCGEHLVGVRNQIDLETMD